MSIVVSFDCSDDCGIDFQQNNCNPSMDCDRCNNRVLVWNLIRLDSNEREYLDCDNNIDNIVNELKN